MNHSYGMQLALAWDQPASIGTRVPAASGDVTGFKTLTMGAAVNFFDPRNAPRTGDAIWNPALTTQDFSIVLVDKAGKEGVVPAASPRYGNALHQTTGSTTARTHIVLNAIRVPLSDFKAQGVDLTSIRKVELRFGGAGQPATGSIQLSDVRFQEAVGGSAVYTDKLADVPVTAPATPAAEIAATTGVGRCGAGGRGDDGSGDDRNGGGDRRHDGVHRGDDDHLGQGDHAASSSLKGAVGCATSVSVAIAKVGKASKSKAVRAKIAASAWTASTKLAKGRYKVTVAGKSKLGHRPVARRETALRSTTEGRSVDRPFGV